MNTTTKPSGPHNCAGCVLYEDYDGTMMCTNAIHWHGGTPPDPECFQYAPAFLAAVDRHLRLVESLGMDHPDTQRAMMVSMELAPPHIHAMMGDMARDMGLIPEADGYLADGTPLYRLEDIAERLGIPPDEAEAALQSMLAEREGLGLSNAGLVTDPAAIHRKQ